MKQNESNPFQKFIDSVLKFRNERDWKQFHAPKDSAIALVFEATEVLEHFQWKNDTEVSTYIKGKKKEIGDELSDVLFWVLLMSHDLEIDLPKAFKMKMKQNRKKYPIAKAKGKHIKYTEL